MEKVIEKVKEICSYCEEEKVLEIRERDIKGLVNGMEVAYKEEYIYCPDCEEAWYSRNQLNKSLTNAKLTNKN